MKINYFLTLPIFVLFTLSIMSANAYSLPAIEFEDAPFKAYYGTWSLGWEFNVIQSITVTGLGFYDDKGDGLKENHDVGIFNNKGELLVSGTVFANDPLLGFFRYTVVTPIVLSIGNDYRIAAANGSEYYTYI